MKVAYLFCVFFLMELCSSSIVPQGGDDDEAPAPKIDKSDLEEPLDEVDEKNFEELFREPNSGNATEEKRRADALKVVETEIHEINEEYEAGKVSWFDRLNPLSDMPEDEFLSQKTGSVDADGYARGLLEPPEDEKVDEKSERYFDQFRYSRSSAPDSYSSVDRGYVSPIKNQRNCGSCVAFASAAVIETAFKKKVGVFGDYSEQQFVDCGFGINGANGCDGAVPYAYLKWIADTRLMPAHEAQYPYKSVRNTCPASLPEYNQGVRVKESYYSYKNDEELMKQMVYEHGAVVASVKSKGPFSDYGGGVFSGCPHDPSAGTDHAIAVVGYGTEGGVPYWLIKNSWGENWGDKGFIKLQRGVNMCNIGSFYATISVEAVAGPTNAPMTTERPCLDEYSNCPDLAQRSCYQDNIGEKCRKSCGLCPGMTPASSYTCYDKYSNCATLCGSYPNDCKKSCGLCSGGGGSVTTVAPDSACKDMFSNCAELAATSCYQTHIKEGCPKSCGTCPGMTPARSLTCYDQYTNCGNYKDMCYDTQISSACKITCNKC